MKATLLPLVTAALVTHGLSGQSPAPPGQSTETGITVPRWAFPTAPAPNPLPVPDSVRKHYLPQSSRSFTVYEALNAYDIVDWFPGTHPDMPTPVRYGRRPEPRACGYCHLPNGAGRPENATLAGLPADYIARQVTAFRDRTRLAANPASNTNSMHLVATSVTDAEVAEAAMYFSRLRLTRRNRIVETSRVPRTRIAGSLYAYDGAGAEPIAGRLIEVPAALERHELHDPRVVYTTYVPPGALARGRRVAAAGPAGPATACATCHGPRLLGLTIAPPIAGRSPTYLLRQLLNFRSGARHDEGSALMQPVVAGLSVDDMVALAAYVGALAPHSAALRFR